MLNNVYETEQSQDCLLNTTLCQQFISPLQQVAHEHRVGAATTGSGAVVTSDRASPSLQESRALKLSLFVHEKLDNTLTPNSENRQLNPTLSLTSRRFWANH